VDSWGALVKVCVRDETKKLLIRSQIRYDGTRLLSAIGQVGLDPKLPHGITLVIKEAKDVITLWIDGLEQ